ncbi:hypothetical protein NPX13_g10322 [Xylaria arbuscula]|uniref:Amino acid permease/ SLC12A domain-containing protein n=1 Tax=Xylaria arbuscula TaxID=114810 RepID=A0A9W8TI57_9PEZI|nr:hypothetical protein NPX13_g10322 [Xylaria arbuscula]
MAPSDSIQESVRPTSEGNESFARDDAALAGLGRKLCSSGTLVSFCSCLDYRRHKSGGPSGILYGFIIVWIGTLSVFATLSEMASMAPTSGGQYHWVSMMAPPRWRKFLSFITGWLTLTGWQASTASGAYLTGTAVQGLIILTHPDYLNNIQNWHGTLLFWAVLLLGYAINTGLSSLLARFEGLVLVFHILGFFAVIFPLVFLSEHSSSEAVWNNWLNLGNWPTQGLSFSIGILGNVFAFVGGDGAVHMSEEVRNPAVTVPWSLMIGLCINGTLGD